MSALGNGVLFGVGVGPGDPELLTVKAMRLLAKTEVIAYFARKGSSGNARATAQEYIAPGAEEIALTYPYTTEVPHRSEAYRSALHTFYDDSARTIAGRLESGKDVAVLCEGDPLFYGSYMYLHDRLSPRFTCRVVPGITSFAGCAAVAGVPLVSKEQTLAVVPGTIPEEELEARLRAVDAAVVIKLGRNFGKVRKVLARLGRLERATYCERGTTSQQIVMPLVEREGDHSPYFSLILVPGHSDGGSPGREPIA
ncbi:MAG: precorrin-2 C(20)-methyltransferase [Polyangiaceae bacterium]